MEMESLSDREILKLLNTVLKKTMFDIEGNAKRIVPVDTGRLRNSINTRKEGRDWVTSANTNYAKFVEFGTVNQKGQSYMRPSAIKGTKIFFPNRLREEKRKVNIHG